MKKRNIPLTISQFAKLHNINRRTLHYYDDIGIFSPNIRGENGYRYYNLSQSMDFEYIRMLKDINMSIDEIREYIKYPSAEKFLLLANQKEEEIDKQIKILKQIKKTIHTQREQIIECNNIEDTTIKLIDCTQEKILYLPYQISDNDVLDIFSYIKRFWSIEQI